MKTTQSPPMLAELIKLHTTAGFTHFGAYYQPKASPKSIAVVWVHGMTGSFVGEVESVLPALLAEAGYPCLAANNRGHGFRGAATELFAGCVPDIQAAIDFMTRRGATRIALIGHSKGGVKASYYMAQGGDPCIAALGVLSPAPNVHGVPHWMAELMGVNDYDSWIEGIHSLVTDGQGDKIFAMSEWPFFVSAATLWDHHNTQGDDILDLLSRVTTPVLALCGGQELDWCTAVTTLHANPPDGYQVHILPEADHLYTGYEADLNQILVDWLRTIELAHFETEPLNHESRVNQARLSNKEENSL